MKYKEKIFKHGFLLVLLIASACPPAQADNIFSRLIQRGKYTLQYQWLTLLGASNLALLAYRIKNQNAKIAAATCALAALCYAIKYAPDTTTLEGLITIAADNANFKHKLLNADNINAIVFARSDLNTAMIRLFPYHLKGNERLKLDNDEKAFYKMTENKFEEIRNSKLSAQEQYNTLIDFYLSIIENPSKIKSQKEFIEVRKKLKP